MMSTAARGEKRPADVIGASIMAPQFATGQIEEDTAPRKESAAADLGRRGDKQARPSCYVASHSGEDF